MVMHLIANTQSFPVAYTRAGETIGGMDRCVADPTDPVCAGAIQLGWLVDLGVDIASASTSTPKSRKRT